jgi:hypothetical protein
VGIPECGAPSPNTLEHQQTDSNIKQHVEDFLGHRQVKPALELKKAIF